VAKVKEAINHQVGIKASPEEIYRALTETEKLAQWWTTDTRGSGAKVGNTLEFWFYGHCQKFNVKELKPPFLAGYAASRISFILNGRTKQFGWLQASATKTSLL